MIKDMYTETEQTSPEDNNIRSLDRTRKVGSRVFVALLFAAGAAAGVEKVQDTLQDVSSNVNYDVDGILTDLPAK